MRAAFMTVFCVVVLLLPIFALAETETLSKPLVLEKIDSNGTHQVCIAMSGTQIEILGKKDAVSEAEVAHMRSEAAKMRVQLALPPEESRKEIKQGVKGFWSKVRILSGDCKGREDWVASEKIILK